MAAIGATGHRILADRDRIDSALDEVVDRLEGTYPPPWTVVSSLAEGADRMIARRLLGHHGARLVAVLPVPPDDYEEDFPRLASRRDFRGLLQQAHEVVVVPPGSGRDAAYEAAGLMVLDRSDVLVAIWDGQGVQGQGGTAEVVAEARRRSLPLAWVHAGNRRPGTEQPTSLGPEQGTVTLERLPDGGR